MPETFRASSPEERAAYCLELLRTRAPIPCKMGSDSILRPPRAPKVTVRVRREKVSSFSK